MCNANVKKQVTNANCWTKFCKGSDANKYVSNVSEWKNVNEHSKEHTFLWYLSST